MKASKKGVGAKHLSALEVINAAGAMVAAGQLSGAVELYRHWLERNSKDPIAYAIAFNLGVVLKDIGDESAAESAYRQAIELNPGCLQAQFNLGSQLERLSRPRDAVAHWQGLVEDGRFELPRDSKLYVMTLNNLGRLCESLKDYPAAESFLVRSLSVEPHQTDVMHHLVYIRQKQCAWPICPDIPGVDAKEMLEAAGPLSVLAASDDPEQQLRRATRYAREKIGRPAQSLTDGSAYGHSRLRVAYLSSDFCLHPVSMLTVELFELHDRSRFDVYGFCWSRDDGSALRKRVVGAFDHYIQIGGLSDEAAAQRIRELEIDILVDLHGLTLGSRPGILGYRPAPVQITYLGFPGTTGIPGIDYVLADRFVLPEHEAKHFSETPLYLRKCFQVSDRQREVGPKPTRSSCGLPEDAFVFCSFNNNYKITPEVFAVWMRILKRVPGSVIWLLADNEWARESLLKEAAASGVAPERVLFATRTLPPDYLARYQIADLFLDTYPFGAGTTASDALSQGLPLLTCPGRTFGSRMAGSMLNVLGLTELIADDFGAYEDIAVAIGTDPKRAAQLRDYLRTRIEHSALFDIPATVREIEALYVQAVDAMHLGGNRASNPLLGDCGHLANAQPESPHPRGLTVEVVSATRLTQEAFWNSSPLGRSLRRMAGDLRLVPKIAFENRRGLPAVYNDRIASSDDADVMLFVHDDVWLDDYFIVDRLLSGLAQFDVVGVAGNRRRLLGQPAWAFKNDAFEVDDAENLRGAVAHGAPGESRISLYGGVASECELLDGVLLAAWKRTLSNRGVRFDSRFDFHFYDLDFCRAARAAGLRLGTWPICITHESGGAFATPAWYSGLQRYRDKWNESR